GGSDGGKRRPRRRRWSGRRREPQVHHAPRRQSVSRHALRATAQRRLQLQQLLQLVARPDESARAAQRVRRRPRRADSGGQAQAFPNGQLVSTNDLRTQSFVWLEPSKQLFSYPTARLDLQIAPSLAWMGSWNLSGQDNQGRRQWPLADIPTQFLFHQSWWIT